MSWKRISSETVLKSKIFEFRIDKCELPDGRIMPKYYLLDFPSWVQVVALDKNQNLILVEQYRYPGNKLYFEFPGGSTDHRGEDTLLAAKRELLEETGYQSDDWLKLGQYYANPALQNNQVYVYLAKNCNLVASPQLDSFEEVQLKLIPPNEFIKICRSQEVPHHGLMLSTLFLAIEHLKSP